MERIGQMYVDALSKKYEAEMQEAKATLALYFNNLVAIGEHSDLMEEHDKWVDKYTNAKDKLESLQTIINELNVETPING